MPKKRYNVYSLILTDQRLLNDYTSLALVYLVWSLMTKMPVALVQEKRTIAHECI